MSTTVHRKDISAQDFNLLARFCTALQTLQGLNGLLAWCLGEVTMLLPVWYKSGNTWRLSHYKEFQREAIGIETADFRLVCRYIECRESVMIDILFRMSILAVVPGQRMLEKKRFRQEFIGTPVSRVGSVAPTSCIGFVLEKRRSDGGFR